MKFLRSAMTLLPIALLGTACSSANSMPQGWEAAAQTCAQVYVLDEIIQTGGDGYLPERVALLLEQLPADARKASAANSEYEQLSTLVGNLSYAIERADSTAVLDLVAVEGECEQLGFGTNPPQ